MEGKARNIIIADWRLQIADLIKRTINASNPRSPAENPIVLLTNQKDYEHFNQVRVEIDKVEIYDFEIRKIANSMDPRLRFQGA